MHYCTQPTNFTSRHHTTSSICGSHKHVCFWCIVQNSRIYVYIARETPSTVLPGTRTKGTTMFSNTNTQFSNRLPMLNSKCNANYADF